VVVTVTVEILVNGVLVPIQFNEAAVTAIAATVTQPAVEPWPEWMRIETAARYLDVPVERVRKLVARRKIPFHQEGRGCRVFFARRDLDAWMAEFRVASLR
jgi:excisionase family DNA binding protein